MKGINFLKVIKNVNRSITTLNSIRFGSNKQKKSPLNTDNGKN